MSTWYLSYDGNQYGPFDEEQARQQIATKGFDGYAWKEGFTTWVPIRDLPELLSPLKEPAGAPKTPPVGPGGISLGARRLPHADEIDFKIFGHEMQFVEIELDPGESVVAEAGAMMYKDHQVEMETIFGDGSRSTSSGFMDKLLGAGKRILTGESLFMTIFTNRGSGKAHVAFGAPFPGNIIPVSLPDMGGTLICQKDSYLCSAKGVSIGIYFQKRILTGLFGGEGFIMQKLEGDGMVFVHAGGTVVERELSPGQELHVDTGCIVAIEPSIDFDIRQVGGIKTALFGGEGLFFARLVGPGKVWLQSLPFSRLAGRMLQAAPQHGGSQGEGSILGRFGDLLDGD